MHTLILHPEGNALNNPSLLAIMEEMVTRGQSLVYLGKRTRYFPSGLENVQARALSVLAIGLNRVFRLLGLHGWGIKILWASHVPWLRRHKSKLNLVVCVDREGQMMADAVPVICKLPRAYISFEILFEKETSKLFKRPELLTADKANLVVVQDRLRAMKLHEENGVDHKAIHLLPIGQRGLPKPAMYRVRDEAGIPPDKRVALFLGSTEAWSGYPQILETICQWPADWALLVNARYRQGEKWWLSNALKRRVYFSTSDFLRVDDMSELFSGVDLSFGLYFPATDNKYHGNNLRFIGMASGKIATSLRHNVPIVTNVSGPVGKSAEEKVIGYHVKNANQIPEVLQSHSTGHFGFACADFFTREMDFEVHGPPLVERILATRLRM